jgi:hypothetical protein
MKISEIEYITLDTDGNEIARETGEVFEIESAEDLEALFAEMVAEVENF